MCSCVLGLERRRGGEKEKTRFVGFRIKPVRGRGFFVFGSHRSLSNAFCESSLSNRGGWKWAGSRYLPARRREKWSRTAEDLERFGPAMRQVEETGVRAAAENREPVGAQGAGLGRRGRGAPGRASRVRALDDTLQAVSGDPYA